MSLDVSLRVKGEVVARPEGEHIYVRRGGRTVELTRAQWDELNPGREPVAVLDHEQDDYVFESNITHNMGRMARECGLYEPMWRPDEHGFTHAHQLIAPIEAGLAILLADHERLQEFNPGNGWGNYDVFLSFTEEYLAACKQWPDAEVSVSR